MFMVTMLLIMASIYGAESACGSKGVVSSSGRIVGGQVVGSSADWPWVASLRMTQKNEEGDTETSTCTASLVAPQWVLTAAHCIEGVESARVRIGIAINRLRDEQLGPMFEETALPQNFFIHPKFTKTLGSQYGDIALIRLLKTPNQQQKNIGMACLPPKGMTVKPGRKCIAIGYGNVQFGVPNWRPILKQTRLEVMSERECHAKLLGNFCQDTKSLVCTIDSDLASGFCSGDSGSPFQCQESDKKWYLVGVHSRGIHCGDTVYPKIAVKVTHFLKWIKDTIKSNPVSP